ncbi:hypothetical protein I7I50_02953 [Histoplasma capsulatum G186AR]|nr:hypothetical protein I7I52_00381 [Histoplasma capsulatum]QSS71933.1 hypothetical protein I7I50_02953 [Histoplasma capsulatum G186AR]
MPFEGRLKVWAGRGQLDLLVRVSQGGERQRGELKCLPTLFFFKSAPWQGDM